MRRRTKNQSEIWSPSRDIIVERILRSDWQRAFSAKTQERDFSWTCGFRRMIKDHKIKKVHINGLMECFGPLPSYKKWVKKRCVNSEKSLSPTDTDRQTDPNSLDIPASGCPTSHNYTGPPQVPPSVTFGFFLSWMSTCMQKIEVRYQLLQEI